MKQLAEYETGVHAPDGYAERWREEIEVCRVCEERIEDGEDYCELHRD